MDSSLGACGIKDCKVEAVGHIEIGEDEARLYLCPKHLNDLASHERSATEGGQK